MKVRVKKTGEVLNVADYAKVETAHCNSWGNPIEYGLDEIEIIPDEPQKTEAPAIDLEQRRYEIAKECLMNFIMLQHQKGRTECGIIYGDVVKWSIELADELIKQLKIF